MLQIQLDMNGLRSKRSDRFPTGKLHLHSPACGPVINISETGMAVSTDTELAVGHAHVFKIQNGHTVFSLPGTVVWCQRKFLSAPALHAPPIFHVGISFVESHAARAWRKALSLLTQRTETEATNSEEN